jgi:hypothetical protein
LVQPYFPITDEPSTSKGLRSKFDPPDKDAFEVQQKAPAMLDTHDDGPRRSARVAAKYALPVIVAFVVYIALPLPERHMHNRRLTHSRLCQSAARRANHLFRHSVTQISSCPRILQKL